MSYVFRLSRLRSAGVCAHVPRDHVAATGGVRAGRAAVRLLARVGPLVRREMVRPRENLTANPTRVRFDPAVQSSVPREHIGPREPPSTDFALVGPRRLRGPAAVPRRDVLGQAIVNRERLPARIARVARQFVVLLLLFDGEV